MALYLEDLRECVQITNWLAERLPHVKTFVLNFHRDHFSGDEILRLCREPSVDQDDVDEDDKITSSFRWLMKIGLPEYSTLRFIDVRIFNFLKQQWRDSISRLVEHFNRAEYYLTYHMLQSNNKFSGLNRLRCVDQFAKINKLLCSENLKGIQGNWERPENLRKVDLKFPSGIATIVLQYGGNSCSMALDELLEQCRNIKIILF